MAREHLYRGFHETNNGDKVITLNGKQYRGEWVEGARRKHWCTSMLGEIYAKEAIDVEVKDKNGKIWRVDTYIVIPETVCDCTGLPDKNDNKIFEGDIIYRDNWIGNVYYSTNDGMYMFTYIGNGGINFFSRKTLIRKLLK